MLGPDDGSVDGSREGTKLGSVLGPNVVGGSLCLTGALVGGLSVLSSSLGEALGNNVDGWAVRSYLCDIKITRHEHRLYIIVICNMYANYTYPHGTPQVIGQLAKTS